MTTLPNAVHPLDFGGLPGEFVADLLKKLSKLDGHLFTAIRLSTFWLYFVCIPGSSSNLFGALRLLIQLVRRSGKPILCSSPAPCATWPALFWPGCFAPPPPDPTRSAVSRARFFSSPAPCATWPIICWYDLFASPAPHPTFSGQVKQICHPLMDTPTGQRQANRSICPNGV